MRLHRPCPALIFSALTALAALAAGCSEKTKPPPDAGAAASAAPSLAAAGSQSAPSPPRERLRAPVREGGALSRAVGEEALYVADEDHKVVRRIPLPLPAGGGAAGQAVAMPGAPAAVLALADRVLVTIRDPGLLVILKPDADKGLVESGRIALPADAWGVAVTPDETTALVTSAWTHQLSAVDLARAEKRWSIDLPREPRAVVVRPDGASAYVTHLVGAALTRVDDLGGTPKVRSIELPPAPARAPSGKTLNAALAYAAVLNEEGSRLFVPRHALGALGQGSWFGAMTLDVMATRGDTPVLPKRLPGLPKVAHPVLTQMLDAGLVTSLDISSAELSPVIQPRAAVYRKSKKTILVAGEGDDRVAEFDALSAAPALRPVALYKVGSKLDPGLQIASVCSAPSGLALSADENTAYVFCRSTDDVLAIKLCDPAAPPKSPTIIPGVGRTPDIPAEVLGQAHFDGDRLSKEEALGRRFFYNATDVITSGGLGCAGCHPEGRDDGHVWHEANVTSLNDSERTIFIAAPDLAPNAKGGKIGYPRQTPMLAGRVISNGPYGWHAQNPDLVARLKEGFTLHRWSGVYRKGEGEQLARIQYLRAFLRGGLVTPPEEKRELTAEEKRGQDIFRSEGARCARCHVPELGYTDRIAYPFSPRLPPLEGFDDEARAEFKTPSLRFVAGTPPYFHDGRYRSLEELIEQNNDRMGATNSLSKEERAALISFLRTL
jgi:hypothetical protein